MKKYIVAFLFVFCLAFSFVPAEIANASSDSQTLTFTYNGKQVTITEEMPYYLVITNFSIGDKKYDWEIIFSREPLTMSYGSNSPLELIFNPSGEFSVYGSLFYNSYMDAYNIGSYLSDKYVFNEAFCYYSNYDVTYVNSGSVVFVPMPTKPLVSGGDIMSPVHIFETYNTTLTVDFERNGQAYSVTDDYPYYFLMLDYIAGYRAWVLYMSDYPLYFQHGPENGIFVRKSVPDSDAVVYYCDYMERPSLTALSSPTYQRFSFSRNWNALVREIDFYPSRCYSNYDIYDFFSADTVFLSANPFPDNSVPAVPDDVLDLKLAPLISSDSLSGLFNDVVSILPVLVPVVVVFVGLLKALKFLRSLMRSA